MALPYVSTHVGTVIDGAVTDLVALVGTGLAKNLSIGADPADTGAIRLSNAAVIGWEDAVECTITHVDDTGLSINLALDVVGAFSAGSITSDADIKLLTNDKYLYGVNTGSSSKKLIGMTGGNQVELGGDGQDIILGAGNLIIPSADLMITAPSTPASAGATGTKGTIAWDTTYFYVCTATNTWQRVLHATW
tara:strand:+ start:555 stop:1130 length:576 start_codon:yes stop_codon:yes gene_type:complete